MGDGSDTLSADAPELLLKGPLVIRFLCLGVAMLAAPAANFAAETEDAKLARLFREYLDGEFQRHPAYATAMGNHKYDDRLDDLSPAARAADLKRTEKLLADLPTLVDKAKLTRAGQIDLEIWTHALQLRRLVRGQPRRVRHRPARLRHLLLGQRVLAVHAIDPAAGAQRRQRRAANYLRPQGYRRREGVDQEPAAGADRGRHLAPVGAINFYEKEIFALAGETAATSELSSPCREAVTALKEYETFLKDDVLPRSSGDWRLGKAKFAEKLALELNAGITAAELIAAANAEADRVEREMVTIAKQLYWKLYPGQAVPPDDEAGRRAVVKAVLDKLADDHGTAETFVADAKASVAKITDFIRAKNILTLPEPDACQIIEMPEFQARLLGRLPQPRRHLTRRPRAFTLSPRHRRTGRQPGRKRSSASTTSRCSRCSRSTRRTPATMSSWSTATATRR